MDFDVPVTSDHLRHYIAGYFAMHPECILEHYPDDENPQQLVALTTLLASPKMWFEETSQLERVEDWIREEPGVWFHRCFYVSDYALMESLGYADADGVWVSIHEDGSGDSSGIHLTVECH